MGMRNPHDANFHQIGRSEGWHVPPKTRQHPRILESCDIPRRTIKAEAMRKPKSLIVMEWHSQYPRPTSVRHRSAEPCPFPLDRIIVVVVVHVIFVLMVSRCSMHARRRSSLLLAISALLSLVLGEIRWIPNESNHAVRSLWTIRVGGAKRGQT